MSPFVLLVLLAAAGQGSVQALEFSSGVRRTTMIELYTSEGCNSCPPAEAYLNTYTDNPALWRRFVPLAFHVDYWDYLGWKDRFALPGNAQRQRAYARWYRHSTVYTPAIFVNGKPLPAGHVRPGGGGDAESVGNLRAMLDGRELAVSFDAASDEPLPGTLHAALLGMGLTSEIRAGENRGRHSRHEFVVLEHRQATSRDGRWRISLPSADFPEAGRLALVVWVSRKGEPVPVQAAGTYLP